jgi:hypothetical protein
MGILGPSRILCLGDSLTHNFSSGVLVSDLWPSQMERALRGEQVSNVVAVSGSTVTVTMDSGSFFQPGVRVQFFPPTALVPLGSANHPNRRRGAFYAVIGRSGDVLTLDRAPPSDLPTGWRVIGCGGGVDAAVENAGHQGYTSTQVLAEWQRWFQYGVPAMAIVALGTNDDNNQGSSTVQASPTPTTTTFSVASGAAAAMACAGSYIDVGSNLNCKVLSVSGDAITLATALASPPSTGTTVAINSRGTIGAIVKYLQWLGCPNVLVTGRTLCNFSGGGTSDWTGSAVSLNSSSASRRLNALNAASDCGVPFADITTREAARIAAGVDAGGSYTWHIADSNIHQSEYGSRVLAAIKMDVISAQSGWLSALASTTSFGA